jgi:hypothetical protein
MMVAAFYLGLAAVVVGVYWLIGRDIDRVAKHKDPEDDERTLRFPSALLTRPVGGLRYMKKLLAAAPAAARRKPRDRNR